MFLVIRLLMILLALAMFALNIWFLVYIDRLKRTGCQCAEGWRRTFMEFMLYVLILLFVVSFFVPNWAMALPIVFAVYVVLIIFYIVVTRQFIEQIVASNCKCADTDALWWLSLINNIQVVGLFLVVLAFLMALLFTGRPRRSLTMASSTTSSRRR